MYRPPIVGWCRAEGLSDQEADELLPQLMERLALRMRSFVYDPTRTFRGWLRTFVRRQVLDYRRTLRRQGKLGGRVELRLEGIADPSILEADDGEPHPLLQDAEQVQAAVRARVQPSTWQLFWMVDIDGMRVSEAARELGMRPAAATMALGRVRRMLREEGRSVLESMNER
jgi:RNA polymerase sigma-70 factor (ECF subfamily)